MVALNLLPIAVVTAATFSVDDVTQLCDRGLDLLFVQDSTGSFQDDMPNIQAQLPALLEAVNVMFPYSKTGIIEFRDKPYFPLGEPTDFCYKLRFGELSSDPAMTEWAYSILQPSGGGDEKEDHYQAIVNSLMDPAVGWRTLIGHSDPPPPPGLKVEEAKSWTDRARDFYAKMVNSDDGQSTDSISIAPVPASAPGDTNGTDVEALARVLVIITDASPHFAGDMKKYAGYPNAQHPDWSVPQGLPPNSATIVNGDLNYSCLHQDYMAPEQMRDVLRAYGSELVILHTEDQTAPWAWVNDDLLGNPPDYRQLIDTVSSNLTEAVFTALQGIAAVKCPDGPSTTIAPTTPAATTGAVTTTLATTVAPTNMVSTSEVSTDVVVSPVAPTETSAEDTTHGCQPCPVGPCPCRHKAQLYIKVNDKPKHLHIDYVA